MAAVTRNPINVRYPFELRDQPPDVVQAHRYAFQGLVDVNQAIASLKGQIDAIPKSTVPTGSSTTTNTSTTVIESVLAGLGTLNDQTGNTSYTTQTSDAGTLLILNDASPVAVSLNSVVTPPFALFVTNLGAGTVTLTPTSGTINGGASLALITNQTIWLVFSGTNWLSDAFTAPPLNSPAAATKFLTAYNSATGAFSNAQPAYSDISGTPQLPITKSPVAGDYITGYDSTTGLFSASTTPGISAVIVTAQLTTLGTQGSMTFTDGILTAQTPAT